MMIREKELIGRRFADGFAGAVVSKGTDIALKDYTLDFTTQGVASMLAGGLAAQATGGSFVDGALQAGWVFLFNAVTKTDIYDSRTKKWSYGNPENQKAVARQNAQALAMEKAFGADYNSQQANISGQEFVNGVSLVANVAVMVNPYTGAVSWVIKGIGVGADIVNAWYYRDKSGLYAASAGEISGMITNGRIGAGISILVDGLIDYNSTGHKYINSGYTDYIGP